MRKSLSQSQIPQGARRISSFEPSHSQPSQFSSSQYALARQSIATTNRSSMAHLNPRRSSSSSAATGTGRASISTSSKGGNEIKALNGTELATSISEVTFFFLSLYHFFLIILNFFFVDITRLGLPTANKH
jgi:hypothetical protein